MKPFNLEAALAGEPVVTRDGREVTQLKKFDTRDDDQLVGVLDGVIVTWCKTGDYFPSGRDPHDLFMSAKKRTVWVNFHVFGKDRWASWSETKREADEIANRHSPRLDRKAYPVEIDE